ncbi:MAG: PhoH family protein [Planctomycetes bacterium]|nr:PhoH family protein [Planctomycetota bacterium]
MELSLTLLQPHRRTELFGAGDRHLRRIRQAFGVRLHARNATVRVLGEPGDVARAAAVIERLQDMLRRRDALDDDAVADAIAEVDSAETNRAPDTLTVFNRDATIVPKTDGQRHYVHGMLRNDLILCFGPAGTGKTYLAVAVAVHLLKLGQAKRIVLVRPAVEAGERLGFLPGDLQQKVNPYLRPLFDAMHDMMTFDQLKRFMVNDIIEVIPLAYMRGRTLNNAVIILDEAQNTTPAQMLMFLTRLGHHSRMIVTGDDSQVDLEPGQPSGLIDAVRRLRGCAGVDTIQLNQVDIVRHHLVQDIVSRYAVDTASQAQKDRRSENIES